MNGREKTSSLKDNVYFCDFITFFFQSNILITIKGVKVVYKISFNFYAENLLRLFKG